MSSSTREIQPRAQAALAASPFYELRHLVVEDCGDVLVISGVVSSFYHKQVAQEVVRSVCQDQDIAVDNRIRVQ
ncbi:MAG: BON domain-containing protein [Bryobacteraceae bacterium]